MQRSRELNEALEQRVAERTHNLMAAAEISRATAEMIDVESLLPRVVEMVREQFDLYYVGLFLTDGEGKVAWLRAGTGEAGRRMIEQGWQLEVGGASMIGRCTATGQADIQLDIGEAAVRFSNPLLPSTRSEMALPLRSRGRVIGAMTIQSDRPAAFDQADISTLQNMADQIAAVIYNDRLFTEARAALESLQVTQQRYQVRAWTEYAQTAEATSYEMTQSGVAPLGDRVLPEMQQAVAQQRPVILSRTQTQSQHSALVAPIAFRGGVIGALGIHDEDGNRQWTERDIALVQAVTERMGQLADGLRLLDDTQRREARERLTRQISDHIRGALTVEEAVQRAIKQLGDALDAEMVARIGVGQEPVSGSAEERG
ncbi:MAG: GAF domain-containing protein [Anaerolineae bacterium]|nr:GAF domain-containing protein [Anaerolineae bacterium]